MEKIRVSVVELVGYREWTERLGPDREWFIQVSQSETYARAQRVAAKAGAHILPLRYDYMLVLASSIDETQHREIIEEIKDAAPVPVRASSACDNDPLSAESRAWMLLSKLSPGDVFFSACDGEEMVAIAHVDIDDIMEETRRNGAVKTYNKVIDLLHKLATSVEKWGGLAQYLGGDNVLVVLPPSSYREASMELLSVRPGLKAGIGVSRKARTALQLAADALHEIRTHGGERIVYRVSMRE